VDRGVRATARFGAWLAALGARTGEAIFDGLPGGAARGVREGGRMIRALHTGLVHQYYVLVAAGLAALALMLSIGGLF
jgi:NADH-quinone oxidoreductase subunit L